MAMPCELSPTARVLGISTLLDEAQAYLSVDQLASLVLAVRRTLDDVERQRIPAGAAAWCSVLRPQLSNAVSAYLRPIELLIYAAGDRAPVLNQDQIWRIDAYLDEITARQITVTRTATYVA